MCDLADSVGGVTVFGEVLRQELVVKKYGVCGKGIAALRLVVDTGFVRLASRKKRRPRRSADGRLAMGVGEKRSPGCELVDVGRYGLWVPIHATNPVV